ncbi:MAG TPA: hypothetical protein VM260_25635 [Pirellula sp.]|nr:hypothetical protein [Pirellula sp.]
MTKRHAIITCCDARCGDFLIQHWLKSLRANVNLTQVDVVVLDYGLTESQRETLHQANVLFFPCVKDGFVCNLRYRDMCRLFETHAYDQVLSVDAGDVIFQSDISDQFEQNKTCFRAVYEELKTPFYDFVIRRDDIDPIKYREILHFLDDKRMLNAGAVWGPAEGFKRFWNNYREICNSFDCYGIDQMILNYTLYQEGFVELERCYNFVLVSSTSPYKIKNGVFYDAQGRIIPLVHNAGIQDATRAVRNFGYGPRRNQRKWLLPIGVRLFVAAGHVWKHLRRA